MIDLMAKAAEMNILTNQGKPWPSEKSLLKYLYENMAAASIASLFGISISAVMHKLKKHGIRVKAQGRPRGGISAVLAATKPARGTDVEFAEANGYTIDYVRKFAKKNGITFKKISK